ncbi:hypothetical protein ACIBB3_37655, partial [Streptomyces sp. NPDC051546]
ARRIRDQLLPQNHETPGHSQDLESRSNPERFKQHDVPGGNHNFFNTVWTPGTGPAFATDDVAVEHRNRPGGRCESTNGTGSPQQLTPAEQRNVAIRYATEFFDKYLT